MSKKIIVSIAIILGIALLSFAVVLIVLFINKEKKEYQSPNAEALVGVWETADMTDGEGNKDPLAVGEMWQFCADGSYQYIAANVQLHNGLYYWQDDNNVNLSYRDIELVSKVRFEFSDDGITMTDNESGEVRTLRKWADRDGGGLYGDMLATWTVVSVKDYPSGKQQPDHEQIGMQLQFLENGVYKSEPGTENEREGEFRIIDEHNIFVLILALGRIVRVDPRDAASVNITDYYYGKEYIMSRDSADYVSSLNAQLVGKWDVAKGEVISTGDEIMVPATTFEFKSDFNYELKREGADAQTGTYRWRTETEFALINGSDSRALNVSKRDGMLVLEDRKDNLRYLLTRQSESAYVSPLNAQLLGKWNVVSSTLISSGDEITLPATSFEFKSDFTYELKRGGGTITGAYRWKTETELIATKDGSDLVLAVAQEKEKLVLDDKKNNQRYYLTYDISVADASRMYGRWKVANAVDLATGTELGPLPREVVFYADGQFKSYNNGTLIENASGRYAWFGKSKLVTVATDGYEYVMDFSGGQVTAFDAVANRRYTFAKSDFTSPYASALSGSWVQVVKNGDDWDETGLAVAFGAATLDFSFNGSPLSAKSGTFVWLDNKVVLFVANDPATAPREVYFDIDSDGHLVMEDRFFGSTYIMKKV